MLNSFTAKITGGQLVFQKEELLDAQWLTFEEIKQLEKTHKIRDPWVIESIVQAEK
jgi:NADH pyrophosphatase NudC (nudix superfamily)